MQRRARSAHGVLTTSAATGVCGTEDGAVGHCATTKTQCSQAAAARNEKAGLGGGSRGASRAHLSCGPRGDGDTRLRSTEDSGACPGRRPRAGRWRQAPTRLACGASLLVTRHCPPRPLGSPTGWTSRACGDGTPPPCPAESAPLCCPASPPTVPSRGSGTGTGALTRSERLPWGQESDAGKLLSASGVWGGL